MLEETIRLEGGGIFEEEGGNEGGDGTIEEAVKAWASYWSF